MSLARVTTVNKSRKVWTCGHCSRELPIGSRVLSFTVGFRGYEQKRCDRPDCYPTQSERESSQVSEVYAAQESVDVSSADSIEDLDQMMESVAEACENVASEYEGSEMYEINEDLQERAETLNSAAEEYRDWKGSLDDEPTQGEDETDEEFATRKDEWLDDARETAQSALNDVELP